LFVKPSSTLRHVADKYLLFISRPTGYELSERDGDPPTPGTDVELEDGGGRFIVSKVAPSPLPQDDRLCAYLQER
jgi:hypothetical protein